MLNTASEALSVQMEVVDGNGLLPMRHTDKSYPSAYTFRRYVKRISTVSLSLTQPNPIAEVRQPRLTGTRTGRLVASGRLPKSTLEQWRPAFIGARTSEVALDDLPYRCQSALCGLGGVD